MGPMSQTKQCKFQDCSTDVAFLNLQIATPNELTKQNVGATEKKI